MIVSTGTEALLYGGGTSAASTSPVDSSMYSTLLANETGGRQGLSSAPLDAQLLDLSASDQSGTSMFDVLGAYYGGVSADPTAMLSAYNLKLSDAAIAAGIESASSSSSS
jgi:hypothetical protein